MSENDFPVLPPTAYPYPDKDMSILDVYYCHMMAALVTRADFMIYPSDQYFGERSAQQALALARTMLLVRNAQ